MMETETRGEAGGAKLAPDVLLMRYREVGYTARGIVEKIETMSEKEWSAEDGITPFLLAQEILTGGQKAMVECGAFDRFILVEEEIESLTEKSLRRILSIAERRLRALAEERVEAVRASLAAAEQALREVA